MVDSVGVEPASPGVKPGVVTDYHHEPVRSGINTVVPDENKETPPLK